MGSYIDLNEGNMPKHGGDIYSLGNDIVDIMDFSANINPFGTPDNVKKAMLECLNTVCNYPDTRCAEFCKTAAEFHKLDKNYICVGNGAADIVFRLVHTVKPKNAVILAPTFGEYAKALSEVGCSVKAYMLEDGIRIKNDFEEILDSVDIVFICNPNNPTGAVTSGAYIERLVKKYKDILFVIDECFLDMTECEKENSMLNKIYLYPNLWVLKSLTKMYALAGVRIGYGICSDTALVEKVVNSGQSWSVSSIAQAAGIAALSCRDEREKLIKMLASERIYMSEELRKLGFTVFEPTANFVLFRASGIYNLKEKLLKHKILIRSCSDYINLGDDFYRVCIKTHEENKILIQAIRRVVNE